MPGRIRPLAQVSNGLLNSRSQLPAHEKALQAFVDTPVKGLQKQNIYYPHDAIDNVPKENRGNPKDVKVDGSKDMKVIFVAGDENAPPSTMTGLMPAPTSGFTFRPSAGPLFEVSATKFKAPQKQSAKGSKRKASRDIIERPSKKRPDSKTFSVLSDDAEISNKNLPIDTSQDCSEISSPAEEVDILEAQLNQLDPTMTNSHCIIVANRILTQDKLLKRSTKKSADGLFQCVKCTVKHERLEDNLIHLNDAHKIVLTCPGLCAASATQFKSLSEYNKHVRLQPKLTILEIQNDGTRRDH